jgi:hypothetical protein
VRPQLVKNERFHTPPLCTSCGRRLKRNRSHDRLSIIRYGTPSRFESVRQKPLPTLPRSHLLIAAAARTKAQTDGKNFLLPQGNPLHVERTCLDITPSGQLCIDIELKGSESKSTGVPNVEFRGRLPSNSRGPWITAIVWTAETVPLDRGVGDREQGQENTIDVDRAGLSRVGDVQIRAFDVKGPPETSRESPSTSLCFCPCSADGCDEEVRTWEEAFNGVNNNDVEVFRQAWWSCAEGKTARLAC